MSVEETRPTDQMIEQAWERNGDGGGIAWREKNAKDEWEVHWKKGIKDVKAMKELCKNTPTPYIAHFRAASSSFGVKTELTHPFPVTKTCPLWLSGKTKGYVLFHNGFWGGWSDACKDAAIKSNTPIPPGRWSDTRAMAWLSSIYGIGFMEFQTEQKGVMFGPEDEWYYTGKDNWKEVNGVWCSNDLFTFTRVGGHTTAYSRNHEVYCKNPQCTVVSPLDQHGYCPKHPKPETKSDAPKGNHSEAGGTQNNTLPFRQGAIISLELAERLHKQKNAKGERKIGKKKIEKIRKAYGDIALGGPKEIKAWGVLKDITRKLLSDAGSAS